MLLFLRLSDSGSRQQHIAEDEQNGENVHQYRNLFRLAAGQLDEGVGDDAKADTCLLYTSDAADE